MRKNYFQKIDELQKSVERFAIVTLAAIKGSAPQEIGAKAILGPDGLIDGTIGGGKLEAFAIRHAQKIFGEEGFPKCEILTINLQRDIGMSCGGEVSLFFEYFNNEAWNIAIFGAGHVSQALSRTLQNLDCSIKIFDTRKEWIEKLPRASNVEAICTEDLSSQISKLKTNSFVLVMTQGHATDVPILQAAIAWNQYSYLGVLGSDLKSKKIRSELINTNCLPEQVEKIFCPMGLNLGKNSPEEIAISIAAQILQERDRLETFQTSKPNA